MAEGEPAAADTHKPGENCARDASKVVWYGMQGDIYIYGDMICICE